MNNFDMPTQLDVINFHNTHDTLCVPKGMTLKQLVEDYEERIDYKSRNEKAINILELSSQNKSMCTRPETDTIQSALNILKGGISKYE